VEAAFYRFIAPHIITHKGPTIPHPLSIHSDDDHGAVTIIMTDLREDFPHALKLLDLEHTLVVLEWLARVHAMCFEEEGGGGEGGGTGRGLLWEEACYWHLATRIDELEGVRREWPQLADAAPFINEVLTQPPRTLLHGDAKAPNFLFGREKNNNNSSSSSGGVGGSGDGAIITCAAYDFQYTGGGDGMKDVAYLLCRSVEEGVVVEHEEMLLKYYHDTLLSHLPSEKASLYPYGLSLKRFDYAVSDYVRWRVGWRGGGRSSLPNGRWAIAKTEKVLEEIGLLHQWW